MTQQSRFCIQRRLPADMMRPPENARPASGASAVSRKSELWPNGSALGVRFMGGTPAEQAATREQARSWVQLGNLTFNFNNAPDAEIRVAFNANECAWSYIGTDCRGVPLDQPTMNLDVVVGGIAAHAFGHAIGLKHVRQNPAAGMQWNEAVMLRDLSGPPLDLTPEQIHQFVSRNYGNDATSGNYFDPASIIQDFFPPEWTRNGVGIMGRTALSLMDRQLVAKLYPR